MLYEVSKHGTAKAIYKEYDIPSVIYSKTGTTQKQSDGWYIAANKSFIIGSWVGHQDRRMHFPSLASGSASRTALPVVGEILEEAFSRSLINADLDEPRFFNCPDAFN
jgi:penicillin-binding protein 1A